MSKLLVMGYCGVFITPLILWIKGQRCFIWYHIIEPFRKESLMDKKECFVFVNEGLKDKF